VCETMPRPEDLRTERLNQLLTGAKDQDVYLYDDVLRKAMSLYLLLMEKTIEDYAKIVIQFRRMNR